MNTCKTYRALTSFTGKYLVKGDNMLASKQASKQAIDYKQIIHDAKGPCAERKLCARAFCGSPSMNIL